jgi:streptomycin 6-kinase
MKVPSGLDWWRAMDGGADWLESLPAIVEECAERWALRVGEPFRDANVSLALAVERVDGERAVLKINFPEPESEHEADALAFWAGRGAVRLLESDSAVAALLIERCVPGDQLWAVADDQEATRIGASVLMQLWRPVGVASPFRSLAEEALRWAVEIRRDWEALDRPFDERIVDEAVAACLELGPDQGEAVVLHQDFHGGNVLRSERAAWLAIDPKPLAGEREFDAASLLRDRRWLLGGHDDPLRIRRRLDLLAEELDLDHERLRRWGIAHALAWGVSEGKIEDDMIECARLLCATA